MLFPLIHIAVAGALSAQSGVLDPAFEKIPLNRWLSEAGHSRIRWSATVSPAVLSYQQRMRVRVSIRVDGRDLLPLRGQGQLLMLVQYRDHNGLVYQNHSSVDLRTLDEHVKSVDMVWDLDAFVLPGEYGIAFAVYHPTTGEHGTTQRTLRVDALKGDPFADAWRENPAVEFLEVKDPPESWYLPSLSGGFCLPLETHRPVHIDLLLNSTPTELAPSSQGSASDQNLAVLLPVLKVLTQIDLRNGTTDATVLDLLQQRASFEQHNVRRLDWERLKAALADAKTNTVDARSLGNRRQMAQFFVHEVSRRISDASESRGSPRPLRILIVLSGPMAFSSQADLHPIEARSDPDFRVYYIRCQPTILRYIPPALTSGRGRRGLATGRPASGTVFQADQMDSLENMIKPLKPRVFEVRSPHEFRNALGTMIQEISRD